MNYNTSNTSCVAGYIMHHYSPSPAGCVVLKHPICVGYIMHHYTKPITLRLWSINRDIYPSQGIIAYIAADPVTSIVLR